MQRKRPQSANAPRQLPVPVLVAIDVVLIGISLVVFALFDHVIPIAQKSATDSEAQVASAIQTPMPADPAAPVGTDDALDADVPDAATPAPTATPEPVAAPGDFSLKFADKFTTGEVIQTADRYQSANLNITISRREGMLGKYNEVCFIQDIYVRNIDCLRTVLAKDTFGRAITEGVVSMSERANAIAAINSDFYSHGSTGVVIRNGVLYRDSFAADSEVLIIFRDGTMKTYRSAAELDVQQAMADGAWQSFSFGPSLLDENGHVFERYKSVNHDPRTIIGMIEPGHYLFITVDGRQGSYSHGMTYSECAAMCESLGCKVAFNLDGGKTSQMLYFHQLVNQPYKGGRNTSDLVYVAEPQY